MKLHKSQSGASSQGSRENSLHMEHRDDHKKKKPITLYKPHTETQQPINEEPTDNKFRADRPLTFSERAGLFIINVIKLLGVGIRIVLFAIFQAIGMVLQLILKVILVGASKVIT